MHVSTLSMGISLKRMSVLGPRGLYPLGPKTDILSRDIPHAQSGDIYIPCSVVGKGYLLPAETPGLNIWQGM